MVLSDIHLQKDYKYKSNAYCDQVFDCCSKNQTIHTTTFKEAGFFGTALICDVPYYFLKNAKWWIRKNIPKPDFVFLMGDNNSHNFFRTSDDDIIESTRFVFSEVKSMWGSSVNTVPVIGNHETSPLSDFDYSDP